MQRQHGDHQSIAKLTRLGKVGAGGRMFCFFHQGQAILNQNFAEHEPIGFRARSHHQSEIFFDLRQP